MTQRIKYEVLTATGKLKLWKKDYDGKDVLVDNEVDAYIETDKIKKKLKLDRVRVVKTITDTFDV